MIAGASRFWKPAAVALALLVAACRGPDLDRLAEGERGRVALVRSGHTLVLEDGQVVRLAGVEAPAPGQAYGAEARDALAAVALGEDVRLLYGGARRDGYDRALAHVRLVSNRRWLQGELLEAGAVRVRTWSDNRALGREMFRLEARARRDQRGLWSLPEYQVRLPNEVRGDEGFAVVEGRAGAGEEGGRAIMIGLGPELTLELPRRSLEDFRAAGAAPEALEGRLLRARGRVRRGWDGLVIRIDHPEQIERLRE